MELRQLKYFTTIYEEGQFIKAAQKLHVTQSALSQQIQLLEKELNIDLFDKQKRKVARIVEATPLGHDFYKDAKKIVDLGERAKSKIMDKGQQAPMIRFGTYQLLNKKQIIATLEKIRQINTNYDFKIIEFENPVEVQKALVDNLIDCGISILPILNSKDIDHVYLSEVSMCILVNTHHPFNALDTLNLENLSMENWIEIDHKIHPIYNDVGLFCDKSGLSNRKIVQEIPSLELLCHFVNIGKGIAFAPSYINTSDFPNVVKKKIATPFITLEQVLCYKNSDRKIFSKVKIPLGRSKDSVS